jgi:D-inositol-3-phosphate glycosyltransferase
VIAPGVDLRAFTPAAARHPRPTIICSAAAAEPRKHVGLLVQAFTLLRRDLPEARLVLSQPTAGSLAAVRAAGVDVDAPGVEFVDLDDRETLARAYGEAWVAALPSINEAFGLVLLEAMACGTPIVGYHGGAIPELIDRPGVGTLFDRLDPRRLADALGQTIELAGRAETAGRCRARAEELSTDRCVERYLELYRELGARENGG